MAQFTMVPARNFAIAILTNAERGGELNEEIAKLALKLFLGVEESEPAPLEISEDQLRPYVGRYDAAGATCELTLRDGELILQFIPKGGFPTRDSPAPPAPPPVHVALYAEDRLMVLDEPFKNERGEFLRDDAGAIAWLRLGARMHRREGS